MKKHLRCRRKNEAVGDKYYKATKRREYENRKARKSKK